MAPRDAVALGVDIGTTRVKAVLVGLDGAEIAHESSPTPWEHGSHGGLQVDVDVVADLAIVVAVRAAERAARSDRRVVAIGLTGMAETGAVLGPDNRPLAPGYAWHHPLGDTVRLRAELGAERFARATGLVATVAPSIVKLDWLRTQGFRFDRGQRWLNMPEYVAWRLTGTQSAELSESCRTGLLHLASQQWWDEALAFLGTDRSFLPGPPLPGGTSLGRVGREHPVVLRAAEVAVGGHDHPTAAIGVGAADAGVLSVSLGTAEAHVRTLPEALSGDDVASVAAAGGSVGWSPLGDRMYVLTALPSGATLARLAEALGCDSVEQRLQLSREALTEPRCPGVPAPRLCEVRFEGFGIVGITDGVTRPALWRSAVEDLTNASAQLLDDIARVLGRQEHIVVFGGWTHDPLVRAARVKQLGPAASFSTVDEPGAVGAALLAARGAGLIDHLPVGRSTALPQPDLPWGELS